MLRGRWAGQRAFAQGNHFHCAGTGECARLAIGFDKYLLTIYSSQAPTAWQLRTCKIARAVGGDNIRVDATDSGDHVSGIAVIQDWRGFRLTLVEVDHSHLGESFDIAQRARAEHIVKCFVVAEVSFDADLALAAVNRLRR